MNILRMAREGLRRELTTALHKVVDPQRAGALSGAAGQDQRRCHHRQSDRAAGQTADGGALPCRICSWSSWRRLLLQFRDCSGQCAADGRGDTDLDMDRRIAALEQELRAKEEYLQTTLEEMETSNEELKSTNEEMQSVNEELQSTNEELETSKEELQSVNEELATVNAELQNQGGRPVARQQRHEQPAGRNGGGAPSLWTYQLRITRFTPTATQVINLIQTDIGRPVGHIVSNLIGYDRLVEDMQAVLDSLVSREARCRPRRASGI